MRVMADNRLKPENVDLSDGEEERSYEYESLIRVKEVFDFFPHPRLLTDGNGVIREANHSAAIFFRFPKEFLIGKPLGLFVINGHRSRFYTCLAKLGRGAVADSFETSITCRGTSKDIAVTVNASPIRGDGLPPKIDYDWFFTDISERNRMQVAHDSLLKRLFNAQQDEQKRLARELHDSIGPLLTALSLGIKTTRDAISLPHEVERHLEKLRDTVDELFRLVHNLSVRLRPSLLDDIGLNHGLAQYLAEWSRRTGVPVDFETVGIDKERLPLELETTVFRIVQEATTNVARHSQARLVSVILSKYEGFVTVAVEDDGAGFDIKAARASGRLGLIGMEERSTLAGGTLEIESSPGMGTTILARFPITTSQK
jgi:signal transduction histidine kinase